MELTNHGLEDSAALCLTNMGSSVQNDLGKIEKFMGNEESKDGSRIYYPV